MEYLSRARGGPGAVLWAQRVLYGTYERLVELFMVIVAAAGFSREVIPTQPFIQCLEEDNQAKPNA